MVKEGRTAIDKQSFSRSNAFKLHKNASLGKRKVKGSDNEGRNDRYVEVRNVRTNQSFKKEKDDEG